MSCLARPDQGCSMPTEPWLDRQWDRQHGLRGLYAIAKAMSWFEIRMIFNGLNLMPNHIASGQGKTGPSPQGRCWFVRKYQTVTTFRPYGASALGRTEQAWFMLAGSVSPFVFCRKNTIVGESPKVVTNEAQKASSSGLLLYQSIFCLTALSSLQHHAIPFHCSISK